MKTARCWTVPSRRSPACRVFRREVSMSLLERTDVETLVRDEAKGRKQDLRLWLRLLSCTNLITAEIRQQLRGEFKFTLPRFDLMAQLDRAPEGLRLGELSKRMMVTN